VIPSLLYIFYYGAKKPILLTNILALSFGHDAMSILKVDSFRTGSILLSGLFFYDVWWVFGTKVVCGGHPSFPVASFVTQMTDLQMVSVATSLDLPMKILWPKSATLSMENGTMMLGLGDIVIPGTFVSLALRYDHFRYSRAQPEAGTFTKPYFAASLVAYVAGLAATMAVMHHFRAAQPALLYLRYARAVLFIYFSFARSLG
jgi:minor histocompatibility antigen H13